jgi:hypothetical protein
MAQRSHARPDSFFDRVLIAFAAAVVAILTLMLVPIFGAALTGQPGAFDLWGLLISKIGLAFVVTSAIIGFVAGSEKAADFFGLIWGTHELWENERFVLAALSVLIVGLGVVIAYLFL